MLSPAIPAIGLLADWPPPEKEKVQTDVVRGLSVCNHTTALRISEVVQTLLS